MVCTVPFQPPAPSGIVPHGGLLDQACEFRENRWHAFHSLGRLRKPTLAIALRTARRESPSTGRRLLSDRLDASAVAARTNLFFGFGFFSFHCDTAPAMGVHQLHFAEISQSNVRSNLERLG